ncbi:MAG: nucleotidyltransferase family protein [Candidatus Wukongarchaeota archaeon]|nr:nucleotidyltransferase family protein [Candidatus Wukongarchaeota archaeon]
MISSEDIIKIIKERMDEIKKYGVKKIGLFGSYIRNKQTEKSDIDIIVEFERGKATLDNFMDLTHFLEELIGKNVDLLTEEGVRSIRIKDIKRNIEENVVYVT